MTRYSNLSWDHGAIDSSRHKDLTLESWGGHVPCSCRHDSLSVVCSSSTRTRFIHRHCSIYKHHHRLLTVFL